MSERLAPPQTTAAGHGQWRVRTGVKGLVTSSSGVLLVAERHADRSLFWTLPGGGVHPDESLADGLRREISEELCCQCRVGRPVDRFWYAHGSLDRTASVYEVVTCSLLDDPLPAASEGVVDLVWADPDSLPARTLPAVRRVIGAYADS